MTCHGLIHVTCCMQQLPLHLSMQHQPIFKGLCMDVGSFRMSSRGRNWCFTYFLKDGDCEEKLGDWVQTDENLRGCVWQLECCPTTQRLHIQGYIEYNNPLKLGRVKRHLGPDVHLEARRGTRTQAIAYCRKEETRKGGPWELGSFDINQGKRNDLHQVSECLQNGATIEDVMDEFPVQFIRYRRGIEAMHFRLSKRIAMQWRTVETSVYHGDSGTGKTRKAILEAGEEFFILDQGERVWFDGYEGQKTLIIDDFYGWIKYGMLLRILDGHPYRCEIKGGFVWAMWTSIVITSNKHPKEWYDKGMTDALKRRLTTIMHFDKNFN